LTAAPLPLTIAEVPEVLTPLAVAPAVHGDREPPSGTPAVLWWIVAVGFLLRFGWVLVSHTYRFSAPDHFDFGQEIGCIARSIVLRHQFGSPFPEWSGPTTWIAPVYPFLTAAAFKMFGVYSTASALLMLAFNCAASALTCWPLFLVAREVTNRRVAIVSAALWAIVPQFMTWAVNWVWDVALTTFIVTWIVWIALQLGRDVTLRRWIGFGALWGFAALLNPSLLSFLPFALGYIAWQARDRRERWLQPALLSCAVVLLTIAPWLVRNYHAFGKPVFIRGNFWAEMRFGNSIYADGTWLAYTHPEINPYERQKYLKLGEQGYFAEKKHDVQQFIRQYPGFFVELCFRRVLLYWWGYDDITEVPSEVLQAMGRRIFSTLALIGMLFVIFRRRPAWFLFAALLLTFPLPYYLTYPYGRYRHVIEPILLICAVYAVAHVKEFRRLFYSSDSPAGIG
jgi:4-amino-4-deoxy-L-arabinose transferase-like glycosyltransferase